MKTDLSGLTVLAGLLERAGLKFVDVGGRGSGLKNLLSLAPYAHYFVSEPDAEEAGRLGNALPAEQPWRGVTVFADAIASQRGDATLRITVEPGMSSLLEPDPDVTGRFFNWRKFGIEKTETVRAIPLDDAADQHGFGDACFLKLDTQGTELDIMRSGARLMAGPVLGVYLEANFAPLYKQQGVFADVDGYLRDQGFALCSLNRTGLRRAGYRGEVYSKRVITWAHCLYLREPRSLVRRGDDLARRDLPRLLALGITFQFYDHVFEILECCRAVDLLPPAELDVLAKELDKLSRHVTKRIFRDAANKQNEDVRESLLSRTLRDKNRPEGA
jgi:FkbM family methyltransferase